MPGVGCCILCASAGPVPSIPWPMSGAPLPKQHASQELSEITRARLSGGGSPDSVSSHEQGRASSPVSTGIKVKVTAPCSNAAAQLYNAPLHHPCAYAKRIRLAAASRRICPLVNPSLVVY